MAGSTESAPVAGVMEYCDTVLPPWPFAPKFDTNIQLSSPRIVIDTGPAPVATIAGFAALKLPDTGLIVNADTVLDSVPRTYTFLPYGSTRIGPGPAALPDKANGEPTTGTRLPSAFGQGPVLVTAAQMV